MPSEILRAETVHRVRSEETGVPAYSTRLDSLTRRQKTKADAAHTIVTSAADTGTQVARE